MPKKEGAQVFADRLTALRKAHICEGKKASVPEICEELDIKQGTWMSYENGSQPPFSVMRKIAKYFDVSIDYLYGVEDRMVPALEGIAHCNVPSDVLDYLAKLVDVDDKSADRRYNAIKILSQHKDGVYLFDVLGEILKAPDYEESPQESVTEKQVERDCFLQKMMLDLLVGTILKIRSSTYKNYRFQTGKYPCDIKLSWELF